METPRRRKGQYLAQEQASIQTRGLIPEAWPLVPAWGCLGQLGMANCLSASWGYETGVH